MAFAIIGAITPSTSSLPKRVTLAAATMGEQIGEFKAMVKALHRAGIEVIMDVVYNHTAEGNHLGPTLSFRGIDNTTYYRLVTDQPRYYMDYTGHRKHTERASSASPETDHGQPALLGDRNARGRLPLRPGGRAGARAARGGPAIGVLRHHQSGSSDLSGQVDRRAVGRRRRRLSGRQVSALVGRMERKISRRCAPVLEGRRRPPRRVRLSHDRQQRLVSARQPTSHRQHQLRHRSRRLYPARIWSATTKNTTKPISEDNRDGTNDNHSWNHGVEGETTDPAILELRDRQKRNMLATLIVFAGRSDDIRRRRDRTHAERQQQRLCPGQRTELVRLVFPTKPRRPPARSARIHQRPDRVSPRPSQSTAPQVLPGSPHRSRSAGLASERLPASRIFFGSARTASK